MENLNHSYKLKITGSAEIESSLDDTKDYSIAFKRLGVRKSERKSNDDGTYTYTFHLENLDIVTLIGEEKKVITGKNKSAAKRLRNRAWIHSEDNNLEAEDFYQKFINYVIANFEDIASNIE